jgi:hypothetical protein
MQRPPRKTSNEWIVETVARTCRSENLDQVGLGPPFEVAIEERVPGFSVIRKTIKGRRHVPVGRRYLRHMTTLVTTFERA